MRTASLGDFTERHSFHPRLLERLGRIGNAPGDRQLERLLGLLGVDLHSHESPRLTTSLTRSISPSNSRNKASSRAVFLQAEQVELDDHQDHVGELERREIGRLEPLAGIDDDGRKRRSQKAEEPARTSGSIAAASWITVGCGKT